MLCLQRTRAAQLLSRQRERDSGEETACRVGIFSHLTLWNKGLFWPNRSWWFLERPTKTVLVSFSLFLPSLTEVCFIMLCCWNSWSPSWNYGGGESRLHVLPVHTHAHLHEYIGADGDRLENFNTLPNPSLQIPKTTSQSLIWHLQLACFGAKILQILIFERLETVKCCRFCLKITLTISWF